MTDMDSRELIQLTEDEFAAQYSLVPNHLTNGAWSFGDGPGSLFETYGEELAFVRQQDPRRIWTLIDGNDGDLYVVSGYYFINRIGYLISREPVPEGIDIEVHIPMETAERESDTEDDE